MKIDKTNISATYTHGAQGSRRDAASAPPAKSGESASQVQKRGDSVAFSSDGLALAGSTSISQERIAEIRSRVESGFYNRPSVAEAVARKLIGRLDG